MSNNLTDHIHLQVFMGNPEDVGTSSPGSLRVVDLGAQDLRERILGDSDPYMGITSPERRACAEPLLNALVELSTDEAAHTKPEFTRVDQIRDFVGHWTDLMWPLMQAGNDVANHLEDAVSAEEQREVTEIEGPDKDLSKLLGVLDIVTIAICAQVEVPHARASSPVFKIASRRANAGQRPAFEFPEEVEGSGLLQLSQSPAFSGELRDAMQLLVACGMNIGVRSHALLKRFETMLHTRGEKLVPEYEGMLEWYEHRFSGKLSGGWDELNKFLVNGPHMRINEQVFVSPPKEKAKLVTRFLRAVTTMLKQEAADEQDEETAITRLLRVERTLLRAQGYIASEARGEYSNDRISHTSLKWLIENIDNVLASGLMNNLTPQARKQVQVGVDAIRAYQAAQADTV